MAAQQQNPAKEQESSEEEDYMSNNFLDQIVDTRPGLVFNRAQARRNLTEKKHQLNCQEHKKLSLQQSSKHLEKLNREEALSKSVLTEQSKGLSLMKKMGYKAGEGLGRDGKASIVEPISVEIKLDRGGLGQVEARKRKCEEIERLRQKWAENRVKNEKRTANEYLDNKRAQFQLRKVIRNLHKCQKICYQLDSTSSLKEPELKWFWPRFIMKALNEKKLAKETEPVPKVQKVEESENIESATECRHEYYDKILSSSDAGAAKVESGLASRSVVDLNSVYKASLANFLETDENRVTEVIEEEEDSGDETCEETGASNVYSSSYLAMVEKEKALSDASDDSEDEEEEYKNEELMLKKTEVICMYLKATYLYCVWCGTKYESAQDFEASCPGPTEDDHE